MMLVMPFIFRRISVRSILHARVGGLGYSLRAASGVRQRFQWHVGCSTSPIALHGICYDFFFMTGQMFTDQQAPQHLRSTAQGLFTFLTYGVGMFMGSLLSGVTIDFFTHSVNGVLVRGWSSFWLTSATSAAVIFLLIAGLLPEP